MHPYVVRCPRKVQGLIFAFLVILAHILIFELLFGLAWKYGISHEKLSFIMPPLKSKSAVVEVVTCL